ncbi:hypothetical protein Y696_06225 [Mesotoga sp. H07pep.5.4]|jgi:hypothetical protein|uniref:hypothetical protein n=1 Tax=unclassified Mesotoga TaxID=1184398 RepID=UPI000FF23873|nr:MULTISPECIES: hypothetical protein [unclassified Mesotoga]RLL85848.1 hypothetical protein Y696_06225 [Mesotoga sp. H07pep.5.4]
MGTYKRLTKVLVYFHEDYFVPIKFSYDGIKIIVNAVTSFWVEAVGTQKVYHFSVLTTLGAYNLEFEEDSKKWYSYTLGG